jgi:exodeoxyribonuclease VII small subunit
MSQPAKGGEAELSFEEALKRLEGIVEVMETDELPLETLIARFEEGTRLASACQAKLAAAELRIQQLEKNSTGDAVLKAMTLTSEPEP